MISNKLVECCSLCRQTKGGLLSEVTIPKYLLSSNDVPTPIEVAHMHREITEGTRVMDDMDAASIYLTEALRRLDILRDALSTRLHQCRRVLSPIRKLPVEILAEIFLYASGTSEGRAVKEDLPNLMRSHRYLLGVCKRWREIAISLQDLWACIDIKLGFRDSETSLRNLGCLVDLHLQRSKSSSLYINLISRNETNVRPFIDALVPHSSRWQFAHIAVPAASLQRLIGIKGSLDRLSRLDLSVSDSHSPDPAVFEMFEFAPMLSSLKLSTFVSGQQSIPWLQLTRLELSLSVSQALLVLSLVPHITECLLSCEYKSFDNLNTPLVVMLPHLRSLHVDGFFGSSVSVLSFLRTPILESFSLNVLSLQLLDKDTMETTDLVETLLPFVQRSSQTLNDLTLYGSSMDEEVFTALLQLTPNLRRLSFDDHSGLTTSEAVRAQLTYYPDSSTTTYLIPFLESIKINVVPTKRFAQFDSEVFVDMIESRWRSPISEKLSHIRAVTIIDNKADSTNSAYTRLKAFQQEGLQLSLSA
ncbi:hypothetical protein BDZ94DRAFT_1252305 [Collybia nuda]|uniref:F-box domain-containing protein n=1 Tax=Collybia nuda TaxID=64659 RepID=A0A9P5YCD2_9AGAR|nr:hypothetical protein BDZ94DRAFT_1252305 [Collybia nuda]